MCGSMRGDEGDSARARIRTMNVGDVVDVQSTDLLSRTQRAQHQNHATILWIHQCTMQRGSQSVTVGVCMTYPWCRRIDYSDRVSKTNQKVSYVDSAFAPSDNHVLSTR